METLEAKEVAGPLVKEASLPAPRETGPEDDYDYNSGWDEEYDNSWDEETIPQENIEEIPQREDEWTMTQEEPQVEIEIKPYEEW